MNIYDKAVHDPNQYVVQTHFEKKDQGQGQMFRVQPWRRGYGPSRSRSVDASMDRVTEFSAGRFDRNPPVVATHRTTGGRFDAAGPGKRGYQDSQNAFDETVTADPAGLGGNSGPDHDVHRPSEYGYRTKQEGWNIDTSNLADREARGGRYGQAYARGRGAPLAGLNEIARVNTLDTIKRSSIPTEHLQGATIEPGGKLAPQSSGTYWTGEQRITTQSSRTQANSHYKDENGIGRVRREPGAPESTLVHEIGHHVEYGQNRADPGTMSERDRNFMRSPEGMDQLTSAYARKGGPVEWHMGALKEDDGSTMMDEHGFAMYPKGKQRDTIARGVAAEKVPPLIEATKQEVEYDSGPARIPGGIDTGTREGFADSYAVYHGERKPEEAYSKFGIDTNVKKHRDYVGDLGGPRFGLTMQREKKLGQSAYAHERHRWGQQASWEAAPYPPMSHEQFQARNANLESIGLRPSPPRQIPGQQRLDLK